MDIGINGNYSQVTKPIQWETVHTSRYGTLSCHVSLNSLMSTLYVIKGVIRFAEIQHEITEMRDTRLPPRRR
jgi:hypothetical protein